MKTDLNPTIMPAWEIARAAEENMKTLSELGDVLGLKAGEVLPMGHHLGKVDSRQVLQRLKDAPSGHYVDVTAITPTPLGEGKTTTTLGLLDGLSCLGHRATAAIRQPSGGPTFNIKGSAAGGGLAQCIPQAEFSLGLTGDFDAITNAHNLAMVALTARMQHEQNYDDAQLAKRSLRRLDVDPERVELKWVMDFCAQSLRQIRIGIGGKRDGVEMDSGFAITVSSELMAILAISRDLADLRRRISRIIVARDHRGKPITTADLEVDGAMTAWMVKAIHPNLLQTLEGNPVFVHAGPFANIAIGQSSVLADLLGTRLADYHVTESGFGADIGYEKFWNLKCRYSGLRPSAVVLVATIRALKLHGGGPVVRPGQKLPEAYTREDLSLLEKGCANLGAHLDIVRRSGVQPVVCLNGFTDDSAAEEALVRRYAEEKGALFAVAKHWRYGGEGARELAEAVVEACRQPNHFAHLYPDNSPIRERIETITREVYGGDGVEYSPEAEEKLAALEKEEPAGSLATCMVKTHLSLSHDPERKGRPTGWKLPVRDILHFAGAGFVVPVAGGIQLMPGTGSDPNYRRIDVDTETGRVTGLF